jgi:hypothetical protein
MNAIYQESETELYVTGVDFGDFAKLLISRVMDDLTKEGVDCGNVEDELTRAFDYNSIWTVYKYYLANSTRTVFNGHLAHCSNNVWISIIDDDNNTCEIAMVVKYGDVSHYILYLLSNKTLLLTMRVLRVFKSTFDAEGNATSIEYFVDYMNKYL